MSTHELVIGAKEKALSAWYEASPALASRGIDEALWNALRTSIFPGAKDESILMAVDYCQSRNLDVTLKPVHLVPMKVKNAQTGSYAWCDVPMPGIGLYRIQADRSGTYAGADAPVFGPSITKTFTDKEGENVSVTFPEFCQYTVHKVIGDRVVSYTAMEYWEENYATDSKNSTAPNSMWLKRPCGQIAKCTEAQALRKGWPEVGQDPTAEEMEGKYIENLRDVTPSSTNQPTQALPELKPDTKEWDRAVSAAARGELENVQTKRNISDENLTKLKTEAGLIVAEAETNA